uniref:Uncharacterized protein n=1 Tax=Arundo donax TaxID=35708 RepID=A0A0A9B5X0_ARUDO
MSLSIFMDVYKIEHVYCRLFFVFFYCKKSI